jgi:hypothetical protein
MWLSTQLSKFAPLEIVEELADLWMPEEARHVVAHGCWADVHNVLFSAMILVLAKARLVKLADSFVTCDFPLYISEIWVSFL